ncbi:hypothetical protein BDK51DRAFT_50817 [Blyttiomyces helicus]|uniref:Uncharacterized protein n=1 Tax=Blyttiomyces helicus TaxID=388810 RepID=A0A4P9W7J0_9FUNG|nr:hypothetical protein BDK51DRAFT_50817 [Blyttiomyces helicus]|eukprot:RKO87345.1 hypothetical protein BDK51DRAFT_50817 [Blyttiomyces helicus]
MPALHVRWDRCDQVCPTSPPKPDSQQRSGSMTVFPRFHKCGFRGTDVRWAVESAAEGVSPLHAFARVISRPGTSSPSPPSAPRSRSRAAMPNSTLSDLPLPSQALSPEPNASVPLHHPDAPTLAAPPASSIPAQKQVPSASEQELKPPQREESGDPVVQCERIRDKLKKWERRWEDKYGFGPSREQGLVLPHAPPPLAAPSGPPPRSPSPSCENGSASLIVPPTVKKPRRASSFAYLSATKRAVTLFGGDSGNAECVEEKHGRRDWCYLLYGGAASRLTNIDSAYSTSRNSILATKDTVADPDSTANSADANALPPIPPSETLPTINISAPPASPIDDYVAPNSFVLPPRIRSKFRGGPLPSLSKKYLDSSLFADAAENYTFGDVPPSEVPEAISMDVDENNPENAPSPKKRKSRAKPTKKQTSATAASSIDVDEDDVENAQSPKKRKSRAKPRLKSAFATAASFMDVDEDDTEDAQSPKKPKTRAKRKPASAAARKSTKPKNAPAAAPALPASEPTTRRPLSTRAAASSARLSLAAGGDSDDGLDEESDVFVEEGDDGEGESGGDGWSEDEGVQPQPIEELKEAAKVPRKRKGVSVGLPRRAKPAADPNAPIAPKKARAARAPKPAAEAGEAGGWKGATTGGVWTGAGLAGRGGKSSRVMGGGGGGGGDNKRGTAGTARRQGVGVEADVGVPDLAYVASSVPL